MSAEVGEEPPRLRRGQPWLGGGWEMTTYTRTQADAAAGDVTEHVISTLAQDGGMLRCRHGDRLIVLYGRSVATLELAPRGAVL